MALFWYLDSPDPVSRLAVIVAASAWIPFAAAALWFSLRWRKFGEATLELDSVPAPLGGTLRGHVEFRSEVDLTGDVRLRLICIRRRKKKGKREKRLPKLRDTAVSGRCWRSAGMLTIPISIEIPETLSSTTDSPYHYEQIVWTLGVCAPVPGMNFRADFIVPVFKTVQTA